MVLLYDTHRYSCTKDDMSVVLFANNIYCIHFRLCAKADTVFTILLMGIFSVLSHYKIEYNIKYKWNFYCVNTEWWAWGESRTRSNSRWHPLRVWIVRMGSSSPSLTWDPTMCEYIDHPCLVLSRNPFYIYFIF